jgi:hypothetical protein
MHVDAFLLSPLLNLSLVYQNIIHTLSESHSHIGLWSEIQQITRAHN